MRSGSRRRNAASASALAGGVPGRNRGAQRPYGRALRCAASLRGIPAHLRMAGQGPTRRNGVLRRAIRLVSCSQAESCHICLIKVAPPRAAASVPAAGLCVRDARPARARHRRAGPADQPGSSVMLSGTARAVFLGDPVSSSRPPRLGRSLRSRRTRSAPPTLDPATTHKDSAPTRKTGEDQAAGIMRQDSGSRHQRDGLKYENHYPTGGVENGHSPILGTSESK